VEPSEPAADAWAARGPVAAAPEAPRVDAPRDPEPASPRAESPLDLVRRMLALRARMVER
jgi:hypothetical protein